MTRVKSQIILASTSPRRSEILTTYNIPFKKQVSQYHETDCTQTQSLNGWITEAKHRAYQKVRHTPYTEPSLIIGSDTMVICDNQSLGKPQTRDQAKEMLVKLSGKAHHVISSVCVLETSSTHYTSDAEVCEVTFKTLSEESIDNYIEKYDVCDKAGGYGIQDCENQFVSHFSGSKEAIMGLPIDSLLKILAHYDIV